VTITTEFDGIILAHDPDGASLLRSDSVMGVTQTSKTLVNTTPVRPIESALDLGCGSGLFALLAARRARHVVATDLNDRACDFVVENAATNGFSNIEARVGSLYEPVAGERFDLITSNLPFVVSPDSEYVFRDGGMGGDEISRLAVTQSPDHLTETGVAVITASWAVHDGETWRDPVRGWIEPLECDVWVLGGATQTPEEYIHRWNGALLHDDPAAYSATRDRWLNYYASEQITELSYGVILLQRRGAAEPCKRIDLQDHVPTVGGGGQVDRALRQGPVLAELDDNEFEGSELEAQVFSLVAPHRLNQQLEYEEGGYQARTARMVLSQTCGVPGLVEPLTSQVLLRVDGQASLGQLIDAAASDTGIPRADIAEPARRNFADLASTGMLELRAAD
jgi:methylase of polypeptide subunit release factors